MAAETGRKSWLSLSVAWGYGFGFLLMAFVFLILVPEADGPSPWDPVAFRSAVLEMFANFRLLDELADMGVLRVADVGDGFLTVDLDLLGVSNRSFGWAPFILALGFMVLCLLLRGLRQRLLANRFGLPTGVPGRMSSYFFGRGMNLFFPFGPGDLATARALDGGDGTTKAAEDVVFYNRVFELSTLLLMLVCGVVYLGWGGAVTVAFWTVVLVAAAVSLTQPLGWSSGRGGRANVLGRLWDALQGRELLSALGRLASSPGFLLGLFFLSMLAISTEILGYWLVKQAFSSPLDDYVLMSDLTLPRFAIVVLVAGITRIIPYTFASFGVYETVSVVMFWVMGEGFLAGTTVTLLDSLLFNGMTLLFFAVSIRASSCPSVLETWSRFYRLSLAESAD